MAIPRRGDETFVLAGTEYPMMFPHAGGHQGFVSASPFAPKSQLGERTYNDYTAFSVVAFTNFAGGMGQERIGDATKYYDAQNIDARSGQLVLGPLVHSTTAANLTNFATNPYVDFTLTAYGPIRTEQYSLAAKVTGAGQVVRHIWLPLKGELWGKQATVEIWTHDSGTGLPDAMVASGPVDVDAINERGGWVAATMSATYTLVNATTYWIALWVDALPATVSLPTELLSWYCWYNNTYAPYNDITAKRFGSDSWFTIDGYAPIVWIPDETSVDRQPQLFIGAGEDGVSRVWAAASRHLYYYDESSLPVPVDASAGGDPKDIGGYANCAMFYRADADTHAWIYIGLGDGTDIAKFNGSIGDEEWPTVTGVKAHAMCIHDGLLWLANDRDKVQGWNTTTLGGECPVGNSDYIIRSMASWNGYLWVGKDDGLYRVVVPDGYPTTGDPEAQKVIDFAPLADNVNFSAMCVHQGELFFNVNQGIMRYTSGGVLTPISPEIGLELSADVRATCRALCTTLTSMWALMEAPFEGTSALMAYNDGAWHPIATLPRQGDLSRFMIVEPGWYGDTPRIWWASTICTSYVNMPFGTLRRWLWDDADFYGTGDTATGWAYLTTSWIDGGLRTVTKDWIQVELDMTAINAATDNYEVAVSYRFTEGGAWIGMGASSTSAIDGTSSTSGVTVIDFPVGTYAPRVQLRIGMTRNFGANNVGIAETETPRIHAIILKYMERPDDLQQFTRTYEISSNQSWRNGVQIRENLAERLAWVRTLRESAEPLSWTDWTGTVRSAHIIDYNASENPEVRGDLDTGTITITMRLQVI